MSMYAQALYARGKFFIETGTATSFKRWLEHTNVSMFLIPKEIILQIEHFIAVGDTSSATRLWLRVCNVIENAKWQLLWNMSCIIFNGLVAGTIIYYAFIHVF